MHKIGEAEGLEKLRNLANSGQIVVLKHRRVNCAGDVIKYIVDSPKGMQSLIAELKKYPRGCIDFTSHIPDYEIFNVEDKYALYHCIDELPQFQIGIMWPDSSYYEICGFNKQSLSDEPDYFDDYGHCRYFVLFNDDVFYDRKSRAYQDFSYFYLNDDSSGGY